jgi:hypothetical protein
MSENSMTEKKVNAFLELLDDIVKDNRPWKEKAQLIWDQAGSSNYQLTEFAAWFADYD